MSLRTHEADRRAPLAALLILVGLLLGAGSATGAGTSFRDAAARLGQSRTGATAALARSTDGATLTEIAGASEPASLLAPPPLRIVEQPATTRPLQQGEGRAESAPDQTSAAAYRARAPPAA